MDGSEWWDPAGQLNVGSREKVKLVLVEKGEGMDNATNGWIELSKGKRVGRFVVCYLTAIRIWFPWSRKEGRDWKKREEKREREREREKMVWMAVLLGMYRWYYTVSMTVPDVAVFPLNKIFGCWLADSSTGGQQAAPFSAHSARWLAPCCFRNRIH